MNINCNYIFYEKYEKFIKKAFELVKDFLIDNIFDIQEQQEFGINKKKELIEIDKYHYLINYLSAIRNKIEIYFTNSGLDCLSDELINQIKVDNYINCLIKQNICSKYTKDIVDIFFEELPLCSFPIVWKWGDINECVEIDGTIYAMSTVLLKTRNNYAIAYYNVPPSATISDINDIVNDLQIATDLYNERFSLPNNSQYCCVDPVLSPINLNLYVTSASSILANWSGDATSYTVKLIKDSVVLEESTETGTTKSFTDLQYGENYTVTVEAENCASYVTATQTITVLPYTITITLSTKAQTHLTLSTPLVNYRYYGESFTFNFEDTTIPYYEISTFTVNSVDEYINLVFTSYYSGHPIAGYYTLPFVTTNTLINIDVQITVLCDVIEASYNELTNQLTLENIDT